MSKGKQYTSYLLAIVFGIAYYYILGYSWTWVIEHVHLRDYLLDLARGGLPITAYKVAVSIHDFLINLVLTFPLVLVVSRLRPKYSWRFLFLAYMSCVITGMHPVLLRLISFLNEVGVWNQLLNMSLILVPMMVSFQLLKSFNRAKGDQPSLDSKGA